MAATLTATGITFNDSTTLGSKYGIIPQSRTSVFYQANAPTGWAKVVTQNDKALRVVNGSGGVAGGSIAFTSAFPNSTIPFSGTIPLSGSLTSTTLDANTVPSHTHGVNFGPAGDHAHPYNGIGASGNQQANPGNVRFNGNVTGGVTAAGDHAHPGVNAGATGNSGGHIHPWSASFPYSTSLDLRVQYIDVILCTFS